MSHPYFKSKGDAYKAVEEYMVINEMLGSTMTSMNRQKLIGDKKYFLAKVSGTKGYISGSKDPSKQLWTYTTGDNFKDARFYLETAMGVKVHDIQAMGRVRSEKKKKIAKHYMPSFRYDAQKSIRHAMKIKGCPVGYKENNERVCIRR